MSSTDETVEPQEDKSSGTSKTREADKYAEIARNWKRIREEEELARSTAPSLAGAALIALLAVVGIRPALAADPAPPPPVPFVVLPAQAVDTIVNAYLNPTSVAPGTAFSALLKIQACSALQVPPDPKAPVEPAKCPEILGALLALHQAPTEPKTPPIPPPGIKAH